VSGRVRWSWIAAIAVIAFGLTIAALGDPGPKTQQERVYEIAGQVKCPQCAGQTVAESDTASARAIRIDIAAALDEGQSEAEILDRLAEAYGDQIVLTPTSSGVTGLVWVIPVVVGVCATAGLVVVFRRWTGAGSMGATDADRDLVHEAQDARHELLATGPSADRHGEGDGA
jgi:cytochrome c-type biogenesis protein CcmH/NrfF